MKPLVWIGLAFLVWRISLFILAGNAYHFLPVFGGQFPYYRSELVQNNRFENWFWVWGNFDGVHYLRLAREGYLSEFSQAFFPFYPIMIGILGRIFAGDYLIAGFVISYFSFFIALLLLYKLVDFDWGKPVAQLTIIFLLLFPTSFYFGSIYTEPLFLLLILGSFLAGRNKKWFLAGLLGFFAALTRFVGIFLFPALVLEYYLQNKGKITIRYVLNAVNPLKWLFLIPAGLGVYMGYLAREFGNPLYFITALSVFGPQRTGGEIILLPQVFWRYIKIFFSINPQSLPFFNATFEFVTALGFLLLILISFFKIRASWSLFALFAVLIPTLTGSFSSMPRYVLVAFPAFILLAQIKNLFFRTFLFLTFSLLLVFSVILFTRGYWVA